jgi:GNAT superfamily N-acetyltransferase
VAAPADLPALAALFHEMEVHYDGPAASPEVAVRAALARHIFAAGSPIEVIVAEGDGGLLGLASVSLVFPAEGMAPALFMKDIYVAAAARSRGVGMALMRAVARLAASRGCNRVNWQAARGNVGALSFYARVGARVWDDVVCLRLDGDALARLAVEKDGG